MFGYVGLVQNNGAWAVRAGKASCRLVGVASLGCALRAPPSAAQRAFGDVCTAPMLGC